MSGDVNQGREMQVLARQVDALDAALPAVESNAQGPGIRHSDCLIGVDKPLLIEGVETRPVDGHRVAAVLILQAGIGALKPFAERALQHPPHAHRAPSPDAHGWRADRHAEP